MTNPNQYILYICAIEGDKYTRFCITNKDPDDMDGMEMDDEGVFVDCWNGQKIPNDPATVAGAMNHTCNVLGKNGVMVIRR